LLLYLSETKIIKNYWGVFIIEIENKLLKILKKLLSVDTSNGNEDKLIDILLKYLDHEKIDINIIYDGEGKPNFIAKYGSEKPVISMISHSDTVPIGSHKLWKYNPLGEVRDGIIYGRGAIDNKGPLVSQLLAFEKLVEAGIKGLKFIVFADEERQKKDTGARWIIKNKWMDVKCDYALGEGGGAFSYKSRNMLVVSYGERGAAEVKYKIYFKYAHTGLFNDDRILKSMMKVITRNIKFRDFRSKNEIDYFLENLGLGKFLRLLAKINPSISKLLTSYTSIEILPTYIEVGGNNGYFNVTPSELNIAFNMRLVPGMNKREVENLAYNLINRIIGKGLEYEINMLTFIPSKKSPLNTDFVSFLREKSNDIGYKALLPIIAPASTDLAWFREKGVPSYGFFPATGDVIKYFLTSHSPDEHVALNDLTYATFNTFTILKNFKEMR